MTRDRKLDKSELELKKYLSHRILPNAVIKPEGDFLISTGSASDDARKIFNLYADICKVSPEGFPYNIKMQLPHELDRPAIQLEVDLGKAVESGMLKKLKAIEAPVTKR